MSSARSMRRDLPAIDPRMHPEDGSGEPQGLERLLDKPELPDASTFDRINEALYGILRMGARLWEKQGSLAAYIGQRESDFSERLNHTSTKGETRKQFVETLSALLSNPVTRERIVAKINDLAGFAPPRLKSRSTREERHAAIDRARKRNSLINRALVHEAALELGCDVREFDEDEVGR